MTDGLNRFVIPVKALDRLEGSDVQVALLPEPWHSVIDVPSRKKLPFEVTTDDFGGDCANVTVSVLPVDASVIR
jgi:hypothetical protein